MWMPRCILEKGNVNVIPYINWFKTWSGGRLDAPRSLSTRSPIITHSWEAGPSY